MDQIYYSTIILMSYNLLDVLSLGLSKIYWM